MKPNSNNYTPPKDGTPLNQETSGDGAFRVCGVQTSITCLNWLAFFVVAAFTGIGVGIGYGAFHHDNPCLEEMEKWKYEEGIDPTKHPIALVAGEHLAVANHNVSGYSCIVRFSETLKAKGLIYSDHLEKQTSRRKLEGLKGLTDCFLTNQGEIQYCEDYHSTRKLCLIKFCSASTDEPITALSACDAQWNSFVIEVEALTKGPPNGTNTCRSGASGNNN